MKNLIALSTLLLAYTCGSTQMKETPSSAVVEPGGPDGVKAEMPKDEKLKEVTFTNAKEIESIVRFLASDELKGRDSGSEGIEVAAQFIEKRFDEQGLKPYFQTYRDTLSNFKKHAYNVLGMLEGTDPVLKNEYIVVGAHYDHIGTIKPEGGDAIANGANDNASGTTTVLELARYFAKHKTNKRSLIFTLFSAEEKGLLGSKHLAKKMKAEELNLYVMLNFEMTGVPLKGKDYEVYITGYNMSNLAEVGNGIAEGNLMGFLPTAKEYNLFQRSDNYPFYQEFGVPAHTFCTFDFTNFIHYHKVSDEAKLMDYYHMAGLVNKMIPVLEGIANAPTQEIKMN
ncbi:M20/M25/M40 family metallo-hydrolase [uncultured Croceitalea sp.]|uniref:M28 family metallopeptidase n=1 Tax=uncultured Croceitalea sp. TaxID=1798908 RepID=UPI0033063106